MDHNELHELITQYNQVESEQIDRLRSIMTGIEAAQGFRRAVFSGGFFWMPGLFTGDEFAKMLRRKIIHFQAGGETP